MKKKLLEIITHPLFSGSAIMIVGSTVVGFLNYLYHFIMGRMLEPANYGELAAIISLAGLFGIIPASLNLVIIKYISVAKSKKEISTLINWLKNKVFIASLAFSLLILLVSPIISSFLNINKIYYLMLIAITFIFSIQALLNRSILQGLLKFKEMIISILAESGIKLLISLLFVYIGFKVGGVLVGLLISVALGWYITYLYLRNYTKQDQHTEINLKPLLFFTFPVLIQSISITSIYSSDVLLVKHFFSSYDAGIYASLSTLGKIIFFGAGPIAAVMFPLVSQRHSRGIKYKKILIYSLAATGSVALFISMFYYLFPGFAIRLLYGSAYVKAANLLVWFGIFISLFTLSSLMVSFNLSLGKTKVVILPLIAAISQILAIWTYHQSIFQVVLISIIINALLLCTLLIYSINKSINLWK